MKKPGVVLDTKVKELCMYGHVLMKCKCGNYDTMDSFCRTPVFGELPAGEFQCPSCGAAVRKCFGCLEKIPSRL
jgi:hypothetical protein